MTIHIELLLSFVSTASTGMVANDGRTKRRALSVQAELS